MATKFQCELISWGQVVKLVERLALTIQADGFQPDIIIAIGRGGYVPARLLADYLDMMNLTSFKIEHYTAGAQRQRQAKIKYPLGVDVSGQRVLVVDDVSDSGDTFDIAVQHIRERSEPSEIRTAVLHHKTVSHFVPDYFARKVMKWRWLIYPWAHVEDIGGFIARMELCPADLPAITERLQQDYGIRVPKAILEYILRGKK